MIQQNLQHYYKEFGCEVMAAQQTLERLADNSTQIAARVFEQWSFADIQSASLIQQRPSFYGVEAEDADSYFSIVRPATKRHYQAARSSAIGGETNAAADDFRGWLYWFFSYELETVYLNQEVAQITWQPLPLALAGDTAYELIVLDSKGRQLVQALTQSQSLTLILPEDIWGIQQTAGEATATLNDSGVRVTGATGLLTGSLTLQRQANGETIELSARGKHWRQGTRLNYLSGSDPSWLWHQSQTPLSDRYRPPGVVVDDGFKPLVESPKYPVTKTPTSWKIVESAPRR